jgi:hypothetical protein
MSTIDTFKMSVPVDKIFVVKGPGLTRLKKVDHAYSSEDGIDVELTLKTKASDRTFVRKVRVWGFNEDSGFQLLLNGWERWCMYDHKPRTGEIDIEHYDDRLKREAQEDLEDSAAELARFQMGLM